MQPISLNKTLTAAALVAATSLAGAAGFPDKTVNYIIPFGPGGESDVSARLQEPVFKQLTGQSMAIQYRPGAGGAAGWSQLNGMAADGYTVMGTNLPHIVLQPLQKDVGYKTDEITTLYWFHYTPDALLVPADSPFKTLKDYVARRKKAPGATTLSGSGTNSANHLAQQQFDKLAGIKTTYVPFGGTGPSNTALLGKQVSGSWGYTTVQMQLGDQVRCLAVAMEKRHPKLPNCPTFKEQGFDLVGGAYRGVAVPKTHAGRCAGQAGRHPGQDQRRPGLHPEDGRRRLRDAQRRSGQDGRASWPRSRPATRPWPRTWASSRSKPAEPITERRHTPWAASNTCWRRSRR